MCTNVCFGDYYRGCQHYDRRYYSGDKVDCMSPVCQTSTLHKHKDMRFCNCRDSSKDDRKVVNMFQCKCPECTERDRARRGFQ